MGSEAGVADKSLQDIEITIPSDLVFERVVRESALVVAKHLGFSDDRVADLQLAVSEAVTNAIEHGNNGDLQIKVGVKFLMTNEKLAVQVTDRGQWAAAQAVINATPTEWNLEERLDQDLTRGMGIFLIQKLVDDVELHSDESGTQFTMWFNLDKGTLDTSSMNIKLHGPEKINGDSYN